MPVAMPAQLTVSRSWPWAARGVVGDVHLAEDAADLGRDRLALLGVQVEQGHLGPGGGDGARRAFAQTRGAARDHGGNGAVEFHPGHSYVVLNLSFV
jgi:hypothetical protein